MSLETILSHTAAFVAGAIIGPLAVKYFGDMFTDKRRDREKREEKQDAFETVAARMPELIAEMRADWSKPENRLKRTFHTMPHFARNAALDVELYYCDETHAELAHKLHMLEGLGLIRQIDESGMLKKYRVTDDFVRKLLKTAENP
jgi:hypothetical protein